MSRPVRTGRPAAPLRAEPTGARERRPAYARVLRLRHLRMTEMRCFVLFEGMIALGVLLALTELVDWWAPLALPAAVAAMVKINDMVVGASALPAEAARARPATTGVRRTAVGRAAVSAPPATAAPPAPAVHEVDQGVRGVDQGVRGRVARRVAT